MTRTATIPNESKTQQAAMTASETAGPVDPTLTKRWQLEADTRRETVRSSTIATASKSLTLQIQASEATNEPQHHDNDQEQTKNASEPGASVAAVSVVSSAAKEKDQDKDDKNRAHDNAFRQFLIAPVEPGASITSLGRLALRR
jgi:hypothetical protein